MIIAYGLPVLFILLYVVTNIMRKEAFFDEITDSREEDNTVEEHEHKKSEFLNNKKPMV